MEKVKIGRELNLGFSTSWRSFEEIVNRKGIAVI
tara:strand:- start:116 stop:217 length:102 start_codon:yes stop_codon:yes gene_type:complete